MNDFSDIERELKSLRPRQPSPEFTDRVERALAAPATQTAAAGVMRKRRFNWEINWRLLGLGTAVAAGFILLARVGVDQASPEKRPSFARALNQPTPAIAMIPRLQPDGVTEFVYNETDEGLLQHGGAVTPVRQVRYQKHEVVRWKDPQTGAALRISYPADEVVFMPVSGQ